MVDKTGRRVYTEYNSNRDGIHTKLMRGHRAKEDIMSRYYYMIGHDSNEIRFEEFDGIQELADMHYDGDTRRALADDEYVFDQDEYDAWITEEI